MVGFATMFGGFGGKSPNAVSELDVVSCAPSYAVANAPPMRSAASNSTVENPISLSSFSATIPDGPAPMTATRSGILRGWLNTDIAAVADDDSGIMLTLTSLLSEEEEEEEWLFPS